MILSQVHFELLRGPYPLVDLSSSMGALLKVVIINAELNIRLRIFETKISSIFS
jgi:hypothetical protein